MKNPETKSLVPFSPMTNPELFRQLQLARESVKEAPTPWLDELKAYLADLEEAATARNLEALYA